MPDNADAHAQSDAERADAMNADAHAQEHAEYISEPDTASASPRGDSLQDVPLSISNNNNINNNNASVNNEEKEQKVPREENAGYFSLLTSAVSFTIYLILLISIRFC